MRLHEDGNARSFARESAETDSVPAERCADARAEAEQRMEHIFARIAKDYERFNMVSSLGAFRRWRADLVRQAPVTAESDVLDLAAGTGDVTFALAHAKHPRHIQCTDLVAEMLDVARMHYSHGAAGNVPVDFAVVDAQDIPYADNSFDVVTVAYGIRNMPERERALSEMLRVLKPGGTLACLEFSHPPNRLWRSAYRFYLKHLIPFWGNKITGDSDGFWYLQESIQAFPDQQTFADMMNDAGFEDVRWRNQTGGIAAVHTGRKPLA